MSQLFLWWETITCQWAFPIGRMSPNPLNLLPFRSARTDFHDRISFINYHHLSLTASFNPDREALRKPGGKAILSNRVKRFAETRFSRNMILASGEGNIGRRIIKSSGIDRIRWVDDPRYPVFFSTPSELWDRRIFCYPISKKKSIFFENLTRSDKISLKERVNGVRFSSRAYTDFWES